MKNINTILSAVCFVSFAAALYALYQLPSDLIEYQIIDLTQRASVQPVLDRLYAVVGTAILLGMAAVASGWMSRPAGKARLEVVSTEHATDQRSQTPDAEVDTTKTTQTFRIEGLEALLRDDCDAEAAFTQVLSKICHHTEASQAAAYQVKQEEGHRFIEMFAAYAYHAPEGKAPSYRFGEGLAGQVAKQGEPVMIDTVPEGYIEIISGLGKATPAHLLILPLKHDGEVVGVVEIASFTKFTEQQQNSIQEVLERLALKLLNSDNVSLAEATS